MADAKELLEKETLTYDDLLVIIEQARRDEWKELDISDKGIVRLPPEIGQLISLETLMLGPVWYSDEKFRNHLTTLPEEVCLLTNLKFLSLGKNKLTDIPDLIANLKQLENLYLYDNPLGILPKSIKPLTNLKTLNVGYCLIKDVPDWIGVFSNLNEINLHSNDITGLPESFSRLKNLAELDLSHNKLEKIPESVCKLENLKSLDVTSNPIKSLPKTIGNLKGLQRLILMSVGPIDLTELPSLNMLEDLNIWHNNLKTFPIQVFKLRNLKGLFAGDNGFEIVPSEIRELTNLEKLYLQNNNINLLPDEIGYFKNLKDLRMFDNQLSGLPLSIGRLQNLNLIEVEKNPLNLSLFSVNKQGAAGIKAYLRCLEQGATPLYEAKLVLVGEGGVGKTTLLKALSNRQPRLAEPTTHGVSIDVHSMYLPYPSNDDLKFQLNAWDFGGQEVYRITHQFFFSERSIYLIVWEPRLGVQQCQVEDWLKLIRLRVGDYARVIIVSTHAKTGQRIARIDKPVFLRDYGSMIVDFIEVDSLEPDHNNPNEKYNIPKLKELIASAAKDLVQMGMMLPVIWMQARDELIEIGKAQPRVTYIEFSEVCAHHGLDEISTKTLAGLMHDLGYIVYYGDDERLKDDVVLQPEWLTKAISFVLEDRATQERDGILPDSHLEDVWLKHNFANEPHYDKELYPFFLRLMEKYDVSYRLQDGDASLVAQHVPQVRPNLPWQPEEEPKENQRRLGMVCVMDEAPPGLVPWMIVRTHDYAYPMGEHSLHWQKGMFLRNKRHGEAMLELRGREFHMYAEAIWPEYFMNILRQRLDKLITDNWPGLKDRYSFNVPCQNRDCSGRFKIEALRDFLTDGDETIRCQDCRTKQNIVELLYGFEDYDVREQLTQIQHTVERGFADMGDEFERLRSQIANNFLVTMKAMASEAKNGPRLFTIEPVDGRWQWINKKYKLHLWCEAEDCQHPVFEDGIGVYDFKMTQEWITQIAPYANFIIGVMKTLLPMVAPSVNVLFGADTFDQWKYKGHLNLIQTSLSSVLPEGIKTYDPGRLKEGVLTEPERSGLLTLHSFLREVDPNQERIGLYRVPTYTGDFSWVCKKHYDLMQPKIPEKIV